MNYYNEFDPYAAQWLRNLIAEDLIPDGFVDERSIKDVPADFLKGFAQCHFFAGIGGWPLALRLAGWPDDKPAWTGSCPCQPYSAAGKQKGVEDERDLWPVWFNLIAEVEPAVIFGEQVSAAIGHHWLDRVRVDLERKGYALGAAVLPACAVDAPHKRDRLWFVAQSECSREGRRELLEPGKGTGQNSQRASSELARPSAGDVADTDVKRSQGRGIHPQRGDQFSAWQTGVEWTTGADGKARRVGTDFRLLSHGFSTRMVGLRSGGIIEAESEVKKYGQASFKRPAEVLRAVWERVLSEPTAYETVGEQTGICQAEILLAFLRQLDWSGVEGDVSFPGEEEFETAVRSVRFKTLFARAPRRRERSEQRADKYSDPLQALSRLLAQHAQADWTAYRSAHARPLPLLAHGVPARVGKLRAFGNAIVPEVATEFIAAYVECRP